MRRNTAPLRGEEYELVIVGGGIYGACAAWEAASSGLKVALIDAGDFGNATSGNSLRTLHGGLRHLQRLDFVRMRESIRARRDWLRVAPQLTRPLRFVLPTRGHGLRGRELMRGALWVNDVLSLDRNRGVAPDRRLGTGELWSGRAARTLLAGTRVEQCNGAAVWYDALCLNSERLLLSIVATAVRAGAHASNYVRAAGLERVDGAVAAVAVRDVLSGQDFEIRTRAVLDATGPRVGEWMGLPAAARPLYRASRAFNLLTRPLPFKDGMGFCVPRAGRGSNAYFVLPWNGRSLIGTRHLRGDASARSVTVTREEVVQFVDELNPLLGRFRLCGSDVLGVFAGLLPERQANTAHVDLERAPRIVDHAGSGRRGVYSVIGVKWTTSHVVARSVVATVCAYLGKPQSVSRATLSLQCGETSDEVWGPTGGVPDLVREDGALAARVVADLPVIKAQVLQSARSEMAVQLADLVMRRTPLYLSELLDDAVLAEVATLAARELRWSTADIADQVRNARTELQKFRGPASLGPHSGASRVPDNLSLSLT